jgi:hypothetical protein
MSTRNPHPVGAMTDQRDAAARGARPTSTRHVRLPRQPFSIIRAHLGAYLAMNAIAYGLFAVGVVAALAFPELTAARVSARENGFNDLIVALMENPWLFALVIFANNTLLAGFAQIVLTSMIVPFAGIVLFGYRAYVLGFEVLAGAQAAPIALIPQSLTVLIEFQAYVLLMLGAYLLGRAWLRPGRVGAANRRQGYLHGLRQIGWLSLPALVLFVVGALYEAFALTYLVPVLIRTWG